jgi:hypothetical protein
VSTSPPPIREPWKTDKDGKLISLPWILWLQQLATVGQAEELFSDAALLLSTADNSSVLGLPATSDDVASLAAMIYNPSSSSVVPNDPEMLAWLSF